MNRPLDSIELACIQGDSWLKVQHPYVRRSVIVATFLPLLAILFLASIVGDTMAMVRAARRVW